MPLEPGGVARTRVRQRQYAAIEILAPCFAGCRERRLVPVAEHAADRVTADRQRQFDVRESRHQLRMPQRRAFRPRRQIAGFAFARIAETHRHDRDGVWVVERGVADAQPRTQLLAAYVVEWNAGLMHLAARRLADDQQACIGMRLQHRSATVGQVPRTNLAPTNARHQRVKGLGRRSGGHRGRSIHPRNFNPTRCAVRSGCGREVSPWIAVLAYQSRERPAKPDNRRCRDHGRPHQSVYSNTCTTLFTPATVRTMFTTASASWWLTRPIK